MKTILKQVAGIDVAQDELVVQLGRMYEDVRVELYTSKTFKNNAEGFTAFSQWVNKFTNPAIAVRYVMEATGVYHEALAYWLDEKGMQTSIVLPNKISSYVRSLETKTVTDKTASQAICRFGLERNLECWQRPKAIYKKMRQLTRERSQLIV